MLLLDFSLFFDFVFLIFSLVLLLKKSPMKHVNNLLAITFLLMSVCGFFLSFLNYAISLHAYQYLAYYYPFSLIIVMLLGPSIYFYVRRLFGYPDSIGKLSTWAHALPILPAIIYVVYFATLPIEDRITWILADYDKVRWQEYAVNILFYIQLTIYILLCFCMVRKQLKKSRFIEINGKLTDIYWLRYFFNFSLILFLVKIAVCTIINSDRVNTLVGLLFMDVLFLYLFIKSVWRTGLFMQAVVEKPKTQEPVLRITHELAESYLQTLLMMMEQSKIYLQETCTIDDVALSTHIPKHHLSHILNVQLDKSFHDFVNEYRIQYALTLLEDKKKRHLTIEAVAQKCGFACKASFNRAFKKHTNITPSEYRQIHT